MAAKRKEAKLAKRRKFFKVFGPGKRVKRKPMLGKQITKEKLKHFAKVIEVPPRKKDFEKIARLTEQHILEDKPIEPLLKMTKVSPDDRDVFIRLAEMIENWLNLTGKKLEELTPEQRQKIINVFRHLSEMREKEAAEKAKKKGVKKKPKRKRKSSGRK